ncbi:MAG: 50S ribosomal protein L20 [Brevinematales bacterium]|nr:50S ribosomal protein L20 [Brevinematales bacterium]
MRARYTVASRARRKKVLKLAKGYHGARKNRIKAAKEAVMHALRYATIDRKNRKRDFRNLWIVRINAFVREHGLNYNRFIEGLRKANVAINRKTLSNLCIEDPSAMLKYIEIAKQHIKV